MYHRFHIDTSFDLIDKSTSENSDNFEENSDNFEKNTCIFLILLLYYMSCPREQQMRP